MIREIGPRRLAVPRFYVEVSPDLLVRVLVELVANYWSWAGGGGGYNPTTPELVSN